MDHWIDARIVITKDRAPGSYMLAGFKNETHHAIFQVRDEEGWVNVPVVHEDSISGEEDLKEELEEDS